MSCARPVYDAADVYNDPYFRERGLLIEYEDEVHGKITAPGWCRDSLALPDACVNPRAGRWAPTLRPCSRELGVDETQLAELRADGVVAEWRSRPEPILLEETLMGYRLGVDVGGTFTDVQMQDIASGDVTLVKVLSTPGDQSIGVLEGVREACRRTGASPQSLDLILHGATVVTNLILEGKGAAMRPADDGRQRADPASGARLDAGTRCTGGWG